MRSARRVAPMDPSWSQNGVGLFHSPKFGFGVVDAGRAADMARRAGEARRQAVLAVAVSVDQEVPDTSPTFLECTLLVEESQATHLESLEHVVVYVTTTGHPRRGDLELALRAPSGMESTLALRRNEAGEDYRDWKFMTVRHWGESAMGSWTLRVVDRKLGAQGELASWVLALYGKCAPEASSCRSTVRARPTELPTLEYAAEPPAWLQAVRRTLAGCECRSDWTAAGAEDRPCSTYCCSPDNDPKPWCFVTETTCEPAGWGYCAPASSSTLSPPAQAHASCVAVDSSPTVAAESSSRSTTTPSLATALDSTASQPHSSAADATAVDRATTYPTGTVAESVPESTRQPDNTIIGKSSDAARQNGAACLPMLLAILSACCWAKRPDEGVSSGPVFGRV